MTHTPLRIQFVLPSFTGGGAERVALTLLRSLSGADFSRSLLVMDGSGPLASLVPDEVPVADLGTPRLRRALFSLVAAVRKTQPDVVFSTLGYVNLAVLAGRPFLPRHTQIIVREAKMPTLGLPNTSHPALLRAAYRFLYHRADTVICTSEQMMGEMRQDFAVPPVKLFLLPNPVDEVAVRNGAAPTIREEGEGLRLVSAGRLTRQKGFDRLIEMMPALAENATLTILGEGPERPVLEAQAKTLGLSERLNFVGFHDNPWAFYAGADAFVMASRWEGLPNATLEALACGTPVVATPQSGGIAEIASAAPPGAVTIAEAGEPFITILKNLSLSALSSSSPRLSLLPSQNRVPAAAVAFEGLLTRLSL